MQKESKHPETNSFVYFQVENGILYKQSMDLSAIKFTVIGENIEYVSFNCNGFHAEILDLLYLETRDLEGSDCSYNKGTHSSPNFCTQCETECRRAYLN